jgi:hypothetical protein
VRALTRGQSATARRPGQHRPRFVQQTPHQAPAIASAEAAHETLEALRRLAPVVETRDLAQYDLYANARPATPPAVAA